MTCTDQRVILAYVQIFLDFGVIRFKFHDQINQRSISFHSVIPSTTQDDKHYDDPRSFAQIEISVPGRCKGLTSDHMHGQ
jgi:hypothetical protein